MSGTPKVIVREDGYAAVDDEQHHLSGPVTVRVVEGYAVYDGKEQVTSGTVTIDDPATATQLIAAGAVKEVKTQRARRTKA